jgi:nitroimidazol reductase NimA-like FMN-containing flavoprotein (pyridoxamine 5'-phosphate oxidase superfamily)
MRENPLVCLEVEQMRSKADWRTVVARGHFEDLGNDAEERAMDLIAARFAGLETSTSAHLSRPEEVHRREGLRRAVLFRIRFVEKTGRFELRGGDL